MSGAELPTAPRALSDLGRARDESGEVLAVEDLGGGLVEITVRLPHLAAHARPGEFAQLRAWEGIEPLLRRPFSVAWTEEDRCSFVLEAVGAGTRRLVALRPGAALQALGPLGNGFTLDPPPPRALVVSGGLGCAPFPLLVRALRRAGCAEVTVLSGAATARRLYPAERFRRGDAAVEVVEATDDGSRGVRGLVTELVGGRCAGTSAVYGCGPNPMLAALAATLGRSAPPPLRAEVSLEAPMGCGFGTCLGCALPVRAASGAHPSAPGHAATGDGAVGDTAAGAGADPSAAEAGHAWSGPDRVPGPVRWALCCRQGPVMAVESVAWPDLLALPPAHVA